MDQYTCPSNPPNPWYFLFWPLFFLRYLLLEARNPEADCHPVFCPLDDSVPFMEWFVIPYFLWHLCMIGIHIWLYIRRDSAFFRYFRYLVISMSISTAWFLLYPTCQNLRPIEFPRRNFLTDAVALLYRMDTNTNVCPSEHVIGAVGFFLAARDSLENFPARIAAGIIAILTAVSTVFLKQHSVLDMIGAVPVCLAAWRFSFCGLPGCPVVFFRRKGYADS